MYDLQSSLIIHLIWIHGFDFALRSRVFILSIQASDSVVVI